VSTLTQVRSLVKYGFEEQVVKHNVLMAKLQ